MARFLSRRMSYNANRRWTLLVKPQTSLQQSWTSNLYQFPTSFIAILGAFANKRHSFQLENCSKRHLKLWCLISISIINDSILVSTTLFWGASNQTHQFFPDSLTFSAFSPGALARLVQPSPPQIVAVPNGLNLSAFQPLPETSWKSLGCPSEIQICLNSLGSSSPDSQQEASLSQIQMDFRLLDFLYSIGSFLCHASHLYSQSSFSTEALQLAADWNQGVMHSNLFYAYDLTVDM